jgi:hypothetical protein
VAGKIFATLPPQGGLLHVFVDDDESAASCAEYPEAVEVLLWGTRRQGCRVRLSKATTPLVRELLTESWRRRAPKKVLAAYDG